MSGPLGFSLIEGSVLGFLRDVWNLRTCRGRGRLLSRLRASSDVGREQERWLWSVRCWGRREALADVEEQAGQTAQEPDLEALDVGWEAPLPLQQGLRTERSKMPWHRGWASDELGDLWGPLVDRDAVENPAGSRMQPHTGAQVA